MSRDYSFVDLNNWHDCKVPFSIQNHYIDLSTQRRELEEWLEKETVGNYLKGALVVSFENPEDAFNYKLRWG
jgi:hypothetical protein